MRPATEHLRRYGEPVSPTGMLYQGNLCACRSSELSDERRDSRAGPWRVVWDWVYWKLAPQLEERGLDWVGADLPTCRATDTSIGPLDDVAYVRDLIHSIDGSVVVAGKS